MLRLLDCFSAFVSFGLALDASIAAGRAAPPSHAAAQQQARRLLDAARACASGQPAAQVESAVFAMVAWIDEILARHPGAAAGAAPLQVQLFNSNNAHSEFFHHLSALGAEDDKLREVYWHALVHGFKGQYYFESDDRGELGKLKELHGHQLRRRPWRSAAWCRTASRRSPMAWRIRRARTTCTAATAACCARSGRSRCCCRCSICCGGSGRPGCTRASRDRRSASSSIFKAMHAPISRLRPTRAAGCT